MVLLDGKESKNLKNMRKEMFIVFTMETGGEIITLYII